MRLRKKSISFYDELRVSDQESISLGFCDLDIANGIDVREPVGERWAPKRRLEFKAGRILARAMLGARNCSYAMLLPDIDRVPLWPDGIVGSISHSSRRVCVALADSDKIRCLGLDTEPVNSVAEELHAMLFNTAELLAIRSGTVNSTEVFCAKEALYKAVYPEHREFFDFLDVSVEFDGRSFTARTLKPLHSSKAVLSGYGRCQVYDNHCVAIFWV